MGAVLSRRVLVAAIVAGLGALASAPVASADSFTVNDTTDAPLATSTDTNCVSTNGGTCTLRAAVQAADNVGGASSISVPAGTYTFTVAPSSPACTTPDPYEYEGDQCDSNDPGHGDLDVLSGATVTISGTGSGSTTINPDGVDRAFAVQTGGSLSLSGMTIENGAPAYGPYCTSGSSNYYCYPSSSSQTYSADGGAIYDDGAFTTTGDVVMRGNQAVQGNNGGSGGAIYSNSNSTALSLTGTTFSVNSAGQGSAIYDIAPVDGTISGSTFSDNDTGGGSGTIYGGWANSTQPSLTISGSTFSNNIAGNGGAIFWNSQGALTADGGNTFTGNTADSGGVIYNQYYAHATSLSGDVIKNNTAFDAAVIYQNDYSGSGDSVTLNNDEIDGNSASYVGVGYFGSGAGPTSTNSSYVGNSGADGGVFYLADTSSYGQGTSLTNVTMSGNSSNYGGAIYVSNTAANPLTLLNDTIAFNTASVAVGGIYGASDATPGTGDGVTNTIVAKNSGGDCGGPDGAQFVAAEDSGYNLDSDASCFGYSGHPSSDKVGVDPALSPAAANGGPNPLLTVAEHAGGPSVDAGSNAVCPGTDARGLTRPQTAGDPCDIGAFELLSAGPSLTNVAPSSAGTGQPFNEIVTASDAGAAGPSTGTTIVDALPAGETLYGATPSQGSCSTSAGSPVKVTCALGLIAPGANATVLLVVAEAAPGAVVNTATVTNDEGSNVSATATTQVAAANAPGTAPVAVTGRASAVKQTVATLSGVIAPGGQPTGFFFEYGLTSHYGETTSVGHTGAGSQTVLATLSGLSAATTYHYRVVAINDSGTSYGVDATFKTSGNPPGSVLLDSVKLAVRTGKARIPLTCSSSKRCLGALSITARLKTGKKAKSVACAVGGSANYRIGAHKRNVVKVALRAACMKALASHGGKLSVRVAVRPRSGQQGVVKLATVILK